MGAQTPEPHAHATPLSVWLVIGTAFILVTALVSLRLAQNPESPRPGALRALPEDVEPALAKHAFESDYWPCTDCHDSSWDTNPRPRKLEDEHDAMAFTHAPDGRIWCLDCHDRDKRNRLHLAGGRKIKFRDSWKVCVQCHARKLEDWKAGVHGKRTGHWRGEKTYLTCVECHDPHNPTFKKIKPKPPPLHPEQIVYGGGARADAGLKAQAPKSGKSKGKKGADHE